jgi:hypothetical protein
MVLVLHHLKTRKATTKIAATTEPATIPAMGIDFDTVKVWEGEVGGGKVVGEGERLGVTLGLGVGLVDE